MDSTTDKTLTLEEILGLIKLINSAQTTVQSAEYWLKLREKLTSISEELQSANSTETK